MGFLDNRSFDLILGGQLAKHLNDVTDLNTLNNVKGFRLDAFSSDTLNNGNGVDNRPSDASSKFGFCLTMGVIGFSSVVQIWWKYDCNMWIRLYWSTSSNWKAWKKVTVT